MRHDAARPWLVVKTPAGALGHALPDDPEAVCRIIDGLASQVPSPATWYVVPPEQDAADSAKLDALKPESKET